MIDVIDQFFEAAQENHKLAQEILESVPESSFKTLFSYAAKEGNISAMKILIMY